MHKEPEETTERLLVQRLERADGKTVRVPWEVACRFSISLFPFPIALDSQPF